MRTPALFCTGGQSPLCPASCSTHTRSTLFLGLGNLQPWMQGLIAVAVFLVLVAIAFAINHFWCQEER